MDIKLHLSKNFISESFYATKVLLEKGLILTVKWNIFPDKTSGELIMRPRYVLTNEKEERLSLKILNLKEKVEYHDIFIKEEEIDFLSKTNRKNFTVHLYSLWFYSIFANTINSGDYQIIKQNILDEEKDN